MRRSRRVEATLLSVTVGGLGGIFLFCFGVFGTYDHTPVSPILPLYLYAEETDLNKLYTRDPDSNELIDGWAKVGAADTVFELHGFRFRGSSSRRLPKKSFSVQFADPKPFLFGGRRLDLNSSYTDPTFMREALAMGMWARLDRPASRTGFMDLFINDVYEGLYVQVQRVDERLLEEHGLNPDGTLIRDDFRDNPDMPSSVFSVDIDSTSDPKRLLEEHIRSRGSPDWGSLVELVRWVQRTDPGPAFAAEFPEKVDIDVFIDWLAIHFLIGDFDSFGDDYWIYLDHDDPDARWIFIPWDKDLSFGSHTRGAGYGTANDFFAYEMRLEKTRWGNSLVDKFLATESLLAKLHSRMQYLMEEVFTPEYFRDHLLAKEVLIRGSAVAGPGRGRFQRHPRNHHGEPGRYGERLERILDFIDLRYGFLRRELDPPEGASMERMAAVTLDDIRAGEKVWLIDPEGWAIAAWQARDAPGPGTLRAKVEANDRIPIDRVWTFAWDGDGPTEGELTIFYRNDILADAGMSPENWYAEPVPTGDQWHLAAAHLDQTHSRVEPALPSRANALSNKVVSEIALSPGITKLVLTYSP